MSASPEFDPQIETTDLANEEIMDLFEDREPQVVRTTDEHGDFVSSMIIDGVSYPHFRDAATTKRLNAVGLAYPYFAANHSARMHVLMQKGLVISGGDDHLAMTYNGSKTVDTEIPIYHHPDVERASEEDDEYENGEDLLVCFMNCMEDEICIRHGETPYINSLGKRLLTFAEMHEAFDVIIIRPEFSRLAPIVERHMQRVTSLGQKSVDNA